MEKRGPEKELGLLAALEALLDDEDDLISGLANAAAAVNSCLDDINWAGFYLLKGKTLVLGPFQGLPACSRIEEGKGVCGRAVQEGRPLVVPNVHEFPGHIACDGQSNSEIVIPLFRKGAVCGVLDLDSPRFNRFGPGEERLLIGAGKILNAFFERLDRSTAPRGGKMKTIYLAGGCFWGAEKYLASIPGVIKTEAGYANGRTANPGYEDVCRKNTGHAETVKVDYDPGLLSLARLLELFYLAIDPTSLNRQGHDTGTQYRTGIYYTGEEDLPVIEASLAALQKEYREPVVVEARPLENYYPAEEYHQKYLDKNPGGYCHIGSGTFAKLRERLGRI